MVDEGQVRRIADEICRYLAARPDSEDSVEGIRRWWLAGTVTLEEVEGALGALVGQGVIERRVQPDKTVVYGQRS